MPKTAVKSEIVWMAFQSLSKKDKARVISRLLQDSEFMEDLMDIAVATKRSNEPVRPFEEYLAEDREKRKTR